jgi:hypothetical protein
MNETSDPEHINDSILFLRASLAEAASAPATIGWEAEAWLHQRERAYRDLRELLTAESIAAELKARDDVPRLLAQLAEIVRDAEAA